MCRTRIHLICPIVQGNWGGSNRCSRKFCRQEAQDITLAERFHWLDGCNRGWAVHLWVELHKSAANELRTMVPASARSCMVSSLGNHSVRHQSFLSWNSSFRTSSTISSVHIWRSSHFTQKSPRCQVISALASSAATLPDTDQASRTAAFMKSEVQSEQLDSDEDMSGHGWDEQELARQQVDQESQVTLEWPAICRQVRMVWGW